MKGCIEDKPVDCRGCYFWDLNDLHCVYDNGCYYSLPEHFNKDFNIKNECVDCPYGIHSPCIGWCTREILRSLGRGSKNGL